MECVALWGINQPEKQVMLNGIEFNLKNRL